MCKLYLNTNSYGISAVEIYMIKTQTFLVFGAVTGVHRQSVQKDLCVREKEQEINLTFL